MSSENKEEKSEQAKKEEQILEFWKDKEIFNKTLEKKAPKGEFTFYDGPPFATGTPHYGHILAGTIKDVIPRFKTMRGFQVKRRWGWDCHGLPIEAQVEKELGVSNKKEIEDLGIGKFNKSARGKVMTYRDDWKRIIPRTGRFVDIENDYRTMDKDYMESVWWVFKRLYDKGLIYKGFKSLHLSPVLGTELSNMEVAQGYKDIKDFAVTIALPIVGMENTSLLIWTTTAWTLPGNMAAAINKNLKYSLVENEGHKYIVATALVPKVFADKEHKVLEEVDSSALVGKSYTPPFDYYKNIEFENKENAWKIYHADYVSEEDGTGVVHLAPAFGAEDLELAQKENIPVMHHVDKHGKFVKEIKDFAGQDAKPKDDHQKTDIEIIKYLAGTGALFEKEKIEHSYPHSWRTDEPLLNYAMDSWFVRVTDFKDKLVETNKKVNWVPEGVGQNRFGNWLENAIDWSISRSRFWGATLPVWESSEGKKIVVGSVEDLMHYGKANNNYFVIRHGESENNVKNLANDDDSIPGNLTEKGKEQVREAARGLKEQGVDRIVHSPLNRSTQTAKLLAEELGIPTEKVNKEERFRENRFGIYNGGPIKEWQKAFDRSKRFDSAAPSGESWNDVRKRVGEAIYDLEKKYKGETILVVSHGGPIEMLAYLAEGYDKSECREKFQQRLKSIPNNAEVRNLNFVPMSFNEEFEIDLHRPYIDSVVLYDKDGEEYKRVPDVFDCWFESGSMPYGQAHYPFDKSEFDPTPGLFKKPKGFPAQFIAEGLDQTRGWFYSLLVLGVALFNKSPYENVIVNGLVLAEDGRKMSKSLNNYPEIDYVLNKYGADAMRYYLMSSSLVKGEEVAFREKEVQEIASKVVGRAMNTLTFYEMFAGSGTSETGEKNLLDKWLIARVQETINEVTKNLNEYQLDKATRPIGDLVDDLSTWYVRRNRERIKNGDKDATAAIETLRTALRSLAIISAPVMPFMAEYIYLRVKETNDPESVHLSDWPQTSQYDPEIIGKMSIARELVSSALLTRQKAQIKVRQPLISLTIENSDYEKIGEDLATVIAEEINVKEVKGGKEFMLDTNITKELQEEGVLRDFVRAVQDKRKELGLSHTDLAEVFVFEAPDFVISAKEMFENLTNSKLVSLSRDDTDSEMVSGGVEIRFRVRHE